MEENSISTFINKRNCAVDTSRIKELARRFEYTFDLDNPKGHA